jgi:hypothetical protein
VYLSVFSVPLWYMTLSKEESPRNQPHRFNGVMPAEDATFQRMAPSYGPSGEFRGWGSQVSSTARSRTAQEGRLEIFPVPRHIIGGDFNPIAASPAPPAPTVP